MGRFFRKTIIFAFFALFGLYLAGGENGCLGLLWEAPLKEKTQSDYDHATESLIAAWEAQTGRRLVPGAHRKAILKIATHMGPGLCTPKPLIRAVAAALERRGFKRAEISLADMNRRHLFETGFLKSVRQTGQTWEGMAVVALAEDIPPNETWYYESPLPTMDRLIQAEQAAGAALRPALLESDRKSYLSTPLFLESDFWINLPVVCDSPGIGIDGVLAGASVRTVSNNERFLLSSATGPVAVAEIAAIPELRSKLAFSLVSLESFQFIGGPVFNAYYNAHEPFLWLGCDAVWMDRQFFERFNQRRKWNGLPAMELPLFLEYARTLGLGVAALEKGRIEAVH